MQEKVNDKDEEQVTEESSQTSVAVMGKRLYERFRINFKAYIRFSDGGVTQEAQAVVISMGWLLCIPSLLMRWIKF